LDRSWCGSQLTVFIDICDLLSKLDVS
jgi:hypothetical protein